MARPEALSPDIRNLILTLRREGLGYRRIAKRLNTAGINPPGGGREWYPTSVKLVCDRYGVERGTR